MENKYKEPILGVVRSSCALGKSIGEQSIIYFVEKFVLMYSSYSPTFSWFTTPHSCHLFLNIVILSFRFHLPRAAIILIVARVTNLVNYRADFGEKSYRE